ncbi:MAG: CBS domain-containing protein [Acidobacteria bacterium]|nr:CBS domain-containing protein [Acidobacteriota bacterium]
MEESQSRRRADQARVRDYMTPQPEALEASQNLLEAVLLLRKSGFRHIPVLDQGQLAGVISERDLWRFSPTMLIPLSPQDYNRVFEETRIGKVMTRDPQTIAPDAPLFQAVNLLFQNRLGCLPVMDADQLVGIITVRDMLRALNDLIEPAPSPQQTSD